MDRREVERVVRELQASRTTWLPQTARVVGVHLGAGTAGGLARPHAVDVRLVDADGQDRDEVPVLERVELSAPGIGPAGSVWAVPGIGSRVRVAFYDGQLSRPYVDAVLQDGGQVPARADGEVLVTIGAAELRVRTDGTVVVTGTAVRLEAGGAKLEAAADGSVTVTGSSIDLAGGIGVPDGVVTQTCVCAFTGGPHPQASLTVRARKGFLP